MRDIEDMIADRHKHSELRKSGYISPKHAEMENILDRMMADADALLRLQSASEGMADATADDSDIQDIYAVRDAIENVIEAMRDLEYRISPI